MSAREELFVAATGPGSLSEAQASARLDAYRAEVLAEALSAVRAQQVPRSKAVDEDLVAYNGGVGAAMTAISALAEAGESRG